MTSIGKWLQLHCTGKLDDGKRLEDLLRIRVLGKMYNEIFLYSRDNQIIRQASREYNRVDFILPSDQRDLLIGEEKLANASHHSVMFHRRKCRKLREMRLQADSQEILEEFHVHLETLGIT
ncbi:hypothetical protein BJV82DRAFT_672956 [Fennellomyces sp. T-0311]|nr:hypothetical protein BJV82DRAFT_672956 [Fennellomyces sp. T-0311]